MILIQNAPTSTELNIIAGTTYLTPWAETIIIEKSPKIKVRKTNESEIKPIIPIIKIQKIASKKIIDEDKGAKKKLKPTPTTGSPKSKINNFLSK